MIFNPFKVLYFGEQAKVENASDAAKRLLLSLSGESINYIVSGDSTRHNSYNEMIPYYKKMLGKFGIEVINDSSSGINSTEWLNSTRPTAGLSHAVASTPNTGKSTVMEFSLGINGHDDVINCVSEYLNQKPDAIVVLVSPCVNVPELQLLYSEMSEDMGLMLIDGLAPLDGLLGNLDYMADSVHPNKYGSQRLVNAILSDLLPEKMRTGCWLEDEERPPPPNSVIVVGGINNAFISTSTGASMPHSSWRSTGIMAVEPNFNVLVDHGGNRFDCFFYDSDGAFVEGKSTNKGVVMVPMGCYGMAINITSNGAAWDAESHTVVVEYFVGEVKYMKQPEINKGIFIALPYAPNPNIDSFGNLPSDGKVATGVIDNKWVWK